MPLELKGDKKMTKCDFCGKILKDDAKMCIFCGNTLLEPQQEIMIDK
jgi:RNA polymerase subunit RPABC4/transcription elongation factor Spt4